MLSDHPSEVDVLIVGAGFAGVVMAERLSSQLGLKCLIVDQRDHIGGNAYDYYDEEGILIHKYGPHYFRTNSDRIVDYLSPFTEWQPIRYKVQSYCDDQYWSFPINLNTFEQFIGQKSTSEEFEQWLEENRVDIENPKNSEEIITSQVGYDLYEKFFKGYTIKQWKKDPRELDTSVCGRIPIRTNRDDDYLRESFQALPKEGYTKLFENILASVPEVKVKLNTDWADIKDRISYKHLVYTGPIDSYFNHCYGKLPYRSLKFEKESFSGEELLDREEISGKKGYWQPCMQVNYASADVGYTRIVEAKHLLKQNVEGTSIVREYPADYEETGEPYYPIPNDESKNLYQQYAALAEAEKNVSMIGRLGTYRYYNMDQVIGMALAEFEKMREPLGKQ